MTFNLKIWRQGGPELPGKLVDYTVNNILPEMSFLEMLDQLNEELARSGQEPIAVDSDCREGICGACGLVINGVAHGPKGLVTTCELRMRHFKDGDTIYVEPFRARAFPVVKDLVVDRSAFDRIMAAGGYISVNVGSAPEANAIPVGKEEADKAMDAAVCIGCGACVAACPNASASLFVSAKISHLAYFPQGKVEARRRVLRMIEQMDLEGFGDCSNHGECEAVCPKGISIAHIARMRREYARALLHPPSAASRTGVG
ncbi:MAG TPA: succinate dehydrogenase/fumarate reductase iron-sulfur subunit [Candidatus Nitrosotenuis sp.]|jgi:succinate dehydrogenase / fumarate reductase iron-sulfur subunit|nr:succinate dehydrogenase/fumarate reductase iron-sulfur subunit [Candidatus Nitrosotenuis sp.]